MKIIEAYLELDRIDEKLSMLRSRLNSNVLRIKEGGEEKARIFKDTVLGIEKCLKEYEELTVHIFETLVITKLEGDVSIFESLVKLSVMKKRREVLEGLIYLGGDLFDQKNGERDFIINVFDVSLQSNTATDLIDNLEKLLLSAELNTNLMEN